jgi:hypothetical protein
MIRQTVLLQRARSWRAPDWSIDPGALESAWIEWAEVETIKRCVSLSSNKINTFSF